MSFKSILKIIGFIATLISVFSAAALIAYKITQKLNRKTLAVIECDGQNTEISA